MSSSGRCPATACRCSPRAAWRPAATALFAALLRTAPRSAHSLCAPRGWNGWRSVAPTTAHHRLSLGAHGVPSPDAAIGLGPPFASVRLVRLGGETVLRADLETARRLCPLRLWALHALSSTETGLISLLVMDRHTPLPEGRVPPENRFAVWKCRSWMPGANPSARAPSEASRSAAPTWPKAIGSNPRPRPKPFRATPTIPGSARSSPATWGDSGGRLPAPPGTCGSAG